MEKKLLVLENRVFKLGAGRFEGNVGPMGEKLGFEPGKEPRCEHCGRVIVNYAVVEVNGAEHTVGWNCWIKFRDMRQKARSPRA